jgi:DNA-binding GntR family transcriptional regulator
MSARPLAASARRPVPRLAALDASPALVERTYRALLDAIVTGDLAPGERHTQEALAERLGVSRQPVLQALLLLRSQGLVKDEPNRRGVEVAPMTSAFVQHLYGVRGALDAFAARSAAYRPRPELRERGAALIRAGRAAAAAGDLQAMVDADVAFHRFLYESAHNPLLAETVEVHWHHTRRAMATYLRQTPSLRGVWSEHLAILNAVVRGDARLAERLARDHCEASAQTMQRLAFQPAPHPGGPLAAGDTPTRRRR